MAILLYFGRYLKSSSYVVMSRISLFSLFFCQKLNLVGMHSSYFCTFNRVVVGARIGIPRHQHHQLCVFICWRGPHLRLTFRRSSTGQIARISSLFALPERYSHLYRSQWRQRAHEGAKDR